MKPGRRLRLSFFLACLSVALIEFGSVQVSAQVQAVAVPAASRALLLLAPLAASYGIISKPALETLARKLEGPQTTILSRLAGDKGEVALTDGEFVKIMAELLRRGALDFGSTCPEKLHAEPTQTVVNAAAAGVSPSSMADPEISIIDHPAKGGHQNKKSTEFEGVSDGDLDRIYRDPNTSSELRNKVKREQKARGSRHSSEKKQNHL